MEQNGFMFFHPDVAICWTHVLLMVSHDLMGLTLKGSDHGESDHDKQILTNNDKWTCFV